MEVKKKNWRDVGLTLRQLAGERGGTSPSVVAPGKLYRCGLIDFCTWEELGRPRTIINLRMGEDDVHQFEKTRSSTTEEVPDVRWVHKAIPNKIDKYDSSQPEVREWIADILQLFETKKTGEVGVQFPVLIHCHAGKDRTGIIVATLLLVLGFDEDTVVREFMLCEGVEEADIRRTIQGFREKNRSLELYFRKKVNFAQIKQTFASCLSGVSETQIYLWKWFQFAKSTN